MTPDILHQKCVTRIAASISRSLPVLIICWLLLFTVTKPAWAKPFPRYTSIENNVRFWESIYADYSTSEAVVHDSDDLRIIYDVIPILSHRLPGASKINKPLLSNVEKKYSTILTRLAKGAKPQNKEEQRVVSLFGKNDRKRFQQAATNVRIQIGQKDRFLEGVIRSGAYIKQIKTIFRKKGLPEDLAYLPHVESSFNIKAYSKFGASGIWQFTRTTGKQYLTINYVIDERQDPLLASEAAATFLQENYKTLKSWPLAITAYNYGRAGMYRAQQAHGNYEAIFNHYRQGHFKFASRNFYSEFLAAIDVAKKLERDPSLQLDKPQARLHVTLPAFITARDICQHFNISMAELKRFNPALRQPVLKGKKHIPKGYTLHLENTKKNQKLLSSVPAHFYHSKQKPTHFYRVQRGDTASGIAKKFKISLRALMQANNLNRNGSIFAGQNLRIPTPPSSTAQRTTVTYKQQKQTKIPKLLKKEKNKTVHQNMQATSGVVLGELGVRKITHKSGIRTGTITVLPEESVELLADWLQVQPASLRKLNGLSKNQLLYPDESIQVPLHKVQAKHFAEKRFDFHLETEEDFFEAYAIVGVQPYTVQSGDTVWEICRKKFDLPLWLLKKYNTNLKVSKLQPSQQLTIPIVKSI